MEKIIVHVTQFGHPEKETLPILPIYFQAGQISHWLIRNLKGGDAIHEIHTSQEIHVLRLLRHVRESVEGVKLEPDNLIFTFDSPEDSNRISIAPTEDGDLASLVPGGFFTCRFKELF